MMIFDDSQQRVLGFDMRRNAAVLGAAGSGKTAVLLAAAARAVAAGVRVMVLAPARRQARALQLGLDAAIPVSAGVRRAQTPVSFAHSILRGLALARGVSEFSLLTGSSQDEIVQSVLEQADTASAPVAAGFLEFAGAAFKNELRQLLELLDGYSLSPAQVRERLAGEAAQFFGGVDVSAVLRGVAPDGFLPVEVGVRSSVAVGGDARFFTVEQLGVLLQALYLAQRCEDVRLRERPLEYSHSGLMALAVRELDAVGDDYAGLPQLLLVDDAGELGQGHFNFLRAVSRRGAAIWAFSDPDTLSAGFRGKHGFLPLGLDGGDAGVLQRAELAVVYRHGSGIRKVVQNITAKLPSLPGCVYRAAQSARSLEGGADVGDAGRVPVFVRANSVSEQLSAIGRRLREYKLSSPGASWADMAVLARSRQEVQRLLMGLAAQQIPCKAGAGGLLFAENRLVRELIVFLEHVQGVREIGAKQFLWLLGGESGGLDPLALRRLRARAVLRESGREGERRQLAEIIYTAVMDDECWIFEDDSAPRLGLLRKLLNRQKAVGEMPSKSLWHIWEGLGLAEKLQREALSDSGRVGHEADATLDAVMALFQALEVFEARARQLPLAKFLDSFKKSAVPSDTIAKHGMRKAVTVTTPQSVRGEEFELVIVAGPQDGSWPNTKQRGTLLELPAFESWLRGQGVSKPSRAKTVREELSLFALACSRAKNELMVIPVEDEHTRPSVFYRTAMPACGESEKPSTLPLTVWGIIAENRRLLTGDATPEQKQLAAETLAYLIKQGHAEAHPNNWYGMASLSSEEPLYSLDEASTNGLTLGPSAVDQAEACPLSWVLGRLGANKNTQSTKVGTLVHASLEKIAKGQLAKNLAEVEAFQETQWQKIISDPGWEKNRTLLLARQLNEKTLAYLENIDRENVQIIASEQEIEYVIAGVRVKGKIDLLELAPQKDGAGKTVTVVDLKTDAYAMTGPEAKKSAQLALYQLACRELYAADTVEVRAKLLYVHPKLATSTAAKEVWQEPLTNKQIEELQNRIAQLAKTLTGKYFAAKPETHCLNHFTPGPCKIHTIPAVSSERHAQ